MAENNSSATLLPCPFCGATAAVQNESPADNSGGYFVECKSCGATTNLRYACGDDPLPLLVAQWNARAPSKTAEEAAHQLLIALRTIAAYPVTNLLMNMDAANMQRIAVRALEAQAAPAAVAVPEWDKMRRGLAMLILGFAGRTDCTESAAEAVLDAATEPGMPLEGLRTALAATPALPATEDSSAGDLARTLPDGWVPCTITYEGQYHEDVAYGPTIMMGRLKKWLERYFALKAEVQAEPVAEVEIFEGRGYSASLNRDALVKLAPGNYHLYTAPQAQPAFQQRVQPWMMECFGVEHAADRKKRNQHFLEEALELVQSTGWTQSEAHQLVDYVYGRPWGEPAQEVGGVMVTLAALCLANGLDMHQAGESELARIWSNVDSIRARQAAKPSFSPLPQAQPADALDAARYRYLRDGWTYHYQHESRETLDASLDAAMAAAQTKPADALDWAVQRWNDEVRNRPMVNIHRRSLDDTWRQVITYLGGDACKLVGPSHDDLLAAAQEGGNAAKEA
ncbi:Lar family restriction alleviation protein [Comamonas koreensis]|uniref:Lar family restriction alleviation protein n=1 Tax=Comamonas koreensis TaxID=160825 RepID=UPI0015FA2321|nr:Lar family restriction alleviation protein [Comamonas koreensis]